MNSHGIVSATTIDPFRIAAHEIAHSSVDAGREIRTDGSQEPEEPTQFLSQTVGFQPVIEQKAWSGQMGRELVSC